jgi:hypothetical protein
MLGDCLIGFSDDTWLSHQDDNAGPWITDYLVLRSRMSK